VEYLGLQGGQEANNSIFSPNSSYMNQVTPHLYEIDPGESVYLEPKRVFHILNKEEIELLHCCEQKQRR
jgi:hypothetical protein